MLQPDLLGRKIPPQCRGLEPAVEAHWLLLADSVSGLSGYGDNPTPRLEYTMRLQLTDDVQILPSVTTRDLVLRTERKSRGVTVYPLALPHERGQ